jgi:endonuclease/exonuclease/phosphatase (EEP) superfamily protein YafD
VTTDDCEHIAQNPIATPLPEIVPRGRRARGTLRCILGVLISAGLLAATRLSQLWPSFDVLSHFTLHFAILTIAFAIGYFMPFARVLTAILLSLFAFVGIGAYAHYVSEIPRTLGTVRAGEHQLRLMTFNTRLLNDDAEAIVSEVRRLDPDVATLVELGENKKLAFDLLKHSYPYAVECLAERFCHLAIVSKVPIISSETKGLWKGPPLIRATLGGDYAGVSVIGVHTIRAPHVRAQFLQMGELADYLDHLQGQFVVMGDFNATPFARLLKIFTERTGLRRLTAIPSWPGQAELPQLAIDHVFVSPKIRLLEEPRIGRRSGSDHYPVAVTVALPGS